MNDNKSRDIFYGVVAVATLIVALVGATLAYFSISASSNEGAVSAQAATVSIDYNDGQQVIAQATELIPATLDVVKKVYEKNMAALNAQVALDPELDRSNICLDDNEDQRQQVCSIYRFSVKSDLERGITATLHSELNGFEYLAYAVRDVNSGSWLTLYTDDEGNHQSIALSKCENNDGDEIPSCYTGTGVGKTYTLAASNSIFGYQNNNEYATKQVAATEQVYDLVLFLRENNANQNIDQGKEFHGTIVVDVIGNNGNGGVITGKVNN